MLNFTISCFILKHILVAQLKFCFKTEALLTLVRVRAIGAEGGAHTVHAYPFPLPRAALCYSTAAAAAQQLQLALEVPLLTLQRLQLVLTLPVHLFKFLVREERRTAVIKMIMCTRDQSES